MIRQRHRNFKPVVPSPKRRFGGKANGGWNVQGGMLSRVETTMCPKRGIRVPKPLPESRTKAKREIGQMERKLKLQLQLIACGTCATIIGICAGAFYFMSRETLALNSDLEKLEGAVADIQGTLNEIDKSGIAADVELIVRELEGMGENLGALDAIERANEYSKESHNLIWKAVMLDAEGRLGPAEKAELEAERRELKRRYESRNRIVRCPEGRECR
jgi:hypothetical protein